MIMGSKRKNTTSDANTDDDEYRSKRDRNNQAVKRSRVKSKQRTQETQDRVKKLKLNNKVLEEKIEGLTKDLKFLKELFLAQAQSKADKMTKEELRKLLADDDDEDDEDDEENEAGGHSSKSKVK